MLDGRTILLVGGSGGLGRVAASHLAETGAQIIVTYKENAERAEKLRSIARVLPSDIGIREQRSLLLDEIPALYGLVVLSGDPARLSDSADAESVMRRSHEANYLGPILLAQEAAARMKASGMHGSIVLISTMQATAIFPGSTAYAAQKAALIQGAKILAKECRGSTNIRVNVVCPGVNRAGMAETSIASGKYDRFLHEDVIHRFGEAQDVARAIRFFLEPDNYITGQVLTVDGGLTL